MGILVRRLAWQKLVPGFLVAALLIPVFATPAHTQGNIGITQNSGLDSITNPQGNSPVPNPAGIIGNDSSVSIPDPQSFITDIFSCFSPEMLIPIPIMGGGIKEVPVCDKKVRLEVAKQTKILSNKKNGILEQLQMSNQLLLQMNNVIGRPSASTVMLPIYIGKATAMMSGMAGMGNIKGERDKPSSGTRKVGFDDNPLDGIFGDGVLGTAVGFLPGGTGALRDGMLKNMGVDGNSIMGQAMGGLIDMAFTGTFSGSDLFGLAKKVCGKSCEIKFGDLSVNPMEIFDGGVKIRPFNATDFLYGDGLCKMTKTDKEVCRTMSDIYDGATGGDLLSTGLGILKKNGLFDNIIPSARDKDGNVKIGDGNYKIDNSGVKIPVWNQSDMNSADRNALDGSERITFGDEVVTAIAATNYLDPGDPESWRDPKKLKNINIMRQQQFTNSTVMMQMQGQSILMNSPEIYSSLIKGNNKKGCQQAFEKINRELEKSFNSNRKSSGNDAAGSSIDNDCVSLTNMMTQSRSLRGDVQVMIAVKYTDLLMSMAQLNMLATSGTADGAAATLNAPGTFAATISERGRSDQ